MYTTGGPDPPKAGGLQTPSAQPTEATLSNCHAPTMGLSPACPGANSTAPPPTDSEVHSILPHPLLTTTPVETRGPTHPAQPEPRRHLFRPADPDSHQCQRQLAIPWLRLQHVGGGSPRNEHFGNYGGISIRQPDG